MYFDYNVTTQMSYLPVTHELEPLVSCMWVADVKVRPERTTKHYAVLEGTKFQLSTNSAAKSFTIKT